MAQFFDEEVWGQALKQPDWYLLIGPEYKQLKELREKADAQTSQAIKRDVLKFFEERLERGEVALATEGEDLDAERKAIDTVVIHHTSAKPGYSLKQMNVTHLLNIYAPYFANPYVPGEGHLKGQPIWSNHIQGGKPVFYAYHWLLRMDGTAERLLDDSQIGWHAGSWEVNCRSIGICLDNDYEESSPKPEVLDQLAELIRINYAGIEAGRVIGHRAVNPKTTCPGNEFLDGWQKELLRRLDN
jgi:isocitrate dehydrogenase kinase/phosphatase